MKREEQEDDDDAIEYTGETDEQGSAHGWGRLVDSVGRTEFVGSFQHGNFFRGRMRLACGGALEGAFRDNRFDGDDNCFWFPDGKSCLRGVWREGTMMAARFVACETTFSYDPFPGKMALVRDPYEAQYVVVKKSRVSESAGQGLFARCPLPPNLIVCYYAGVLVSQEIVDARREEQNGNVVLLDDNPDECIDVPAPYDSLEHYAASLGHKANHGDAGEANCEYVDAFHPRFGFVSSIKTLRAVAQDEELLLDYEFIEPPSWWTSKNC